MLGMLTVSPGTSQSKLNLSCLFYDNHQLKEGHNPDSSFVIGFCSDDLEKIEQEVCDSITELGRDYILVDAANKPYRRLLKLDFGHLRGVGSRFR